MTKSQLAIALAEEKNLSIKDAESILNVIINEITSALMRGDRVELRGFGSFSLKDRKGRLGRNPKTGESVEIPEKSLPRFKTGRELHNKLN